jgi:hypothetical protein
VCGTPCYVRTPALRRLPTRAALPRTLGSTNTAAPVPPPSAAMGRAIRSKSVACTGGSHRFRVAAAHAAMPNPPASARTVPPPEHAPTSVLPAPKLTASPPEFALLHWALGAQPQQGSGAWCTARARSAQHWLPGRGLAEYRKTATPLRTWLAPAQLQSKRCHLHRGLRRQACNKARNLGSTRSGA